MAFKSSARIAQWVAFLLLVGCVLTGISRIVLAQDASKPFADVILGQGVTAVIVRDTKGADQMLVTTFYMAKVPGLEQSILRSVSEVVPAVKNVAVAAMGAPDPKSVTTVHVSLLKVTDRMEWQPIAQKENPQANPQ